MKPPNYKGTFESHITVDTPDLEKREKFRLLCQNLGIKCLLIELPEGATKSHPMTASYHHGILTDVLLESKKLTQKLQEADFLVKRLKIEAMVSNQDIPRDDTQAMMLPNSNYFEFHVKVTLADQENIEILRKYCHQHQAHLSQNALKHLLNGYQERFVTMRLYKVGLDKVETRFNELLLGLKSIGLHLSNLQKEYIVYDSNLRLDAGWL